MKNPFALLLRNISLWHVRLEVLCLIITPVVLLVFILIAVFNVPFSLGWDDAPAMPAMVKVSTNNKH